MSEVHGHFGNLDAAQEQLRELGADDFEHNLAVLRAVLHDGERGILGDIAALELVLNLRRERLLQRRARVADVFGRAHLLRNAQDAEE